MLDPMNTNHCRSFDVNGTMPQVWDWVSLLSFVGESTYNNKSIDVWESRVCLFCSPPVLSPFCFRSSYNPPSSTSFWSLMLSLQIGYAYLQLAVSSNDTTTPVVIFRSSRGERSMSPFIISPFLRSPPFSPLIHLCFVLFCFVLFCFVLFCFVLFCFVCTWIN